MEELAHALIAYSYNVVGQCVNVYKLVCSGCTVKVDYKGGIVYIRKVQMS